VCMGVMECVVYECVFVRCMSVWCVCMGECVVYGCEWGMYGHLPETT